MENKQEFCEYATMKDDAHGSSIMARKTLIDKERELFDKIGLFAAGMPSLEQAKMMDDFMLENCKFYKGNNVCSLPNEKCESMPSECIYRKLCKIT